MASALSFFKAIVLVMGQPHDRAHVPKTFVIDERVQL